MIWYTNYNNHRKVMVPDMDNMTFLNKYLSAVKLELKDGCLASCRSAWRIEDHIWDYSKFYFVIKGSGHITIDGIEYILSPGDLVLIPSGKPSSCHLTEEKYLLKYWCDFKATVGNISVFDWIKTSYRIKIEDIEEMQNNFHDMLYNKYGNTPTGIVRKNSLMSSIFYTYMEKAMIYDSSMTNEIDFIDVIKYMEENIKEKLTVNELAAVAFMHPKSFVRAFNKAMGKAPITFLNELRIENSKRSLVETEKNISEIASEVGINDEFYFSRFFASHTGVTPLEYRNKFRT